MSYISYIRSLVGHDKIFLAFASVVLRDQAGRILLQRRADFDVWGLPGGCLELGEDILSCARRELLEESGLTAGPLRLVGIYSEPAYDTVYPNGDQVQQYTVCFEGPLDDGELTADGVETRESRFFAPHEIASAGMPIYYQAMLEHALRDSPPAFSPPLALPTTLDQIAYMRSRIGHVSYIGVGSVGIVTNEQGQLLVGCRTDSGEWSFPGGYANLGENAAYTVVREIREETGLDVEPTRLMGIFSPRAAWVYPNGDSTQSVVSIFRCQLVGGVERADQVETSQLAWLSPQEILALPEHPLLTSFNQRVIQHLDDGWFLL
ncbi:MAG: NUDIX domain-containing protein [Anaerolineales bacterium]|nr:NUDIX domain-containing protein [Anaerolineales bacterium]